MMDLEARVARLERRTVIWQLVAMGSAIATCAMIVNACRKPSADPNHLELVGNGASLRLEPNRLVLKSGGSSLTLEPTTITLKADDRETSARAGRLEVTGEGAASTVKPGALSLGRGNSSIAAKVSRQLAWIDLKSENAQNEIMMSVHNTHATVSAFTSQESPTERSGSSIGSSSAGAGLHLNWKGAEKELKLGQ